MPKTLHKVKIRLVLIN